MTFVEVKDSRINLDNIVRYYPVNETLSPARFYIYFTVAAASGSSQSNYFGIGFSTEEERDDIIRQLDNIIGLHE